MLCVYENRTKSVLLFVNRSRATLLSGVKQMSDLLLCYSDTHLRSTGSFPPYNVVTESGLTKELLNILHGFKFVANQILEFKPKVVVNCGDTFHNTEFISSMTLHGAAIALDMIAKACQEVGAHHIIIPGNHDILIQDPSKVITSITPLTGFGEICLKRHIHEVNGFKIGIVPYNSDHERAYSDLVELQNQCDLLVTHLDFCGAQYDTGRISESKIEPNFDVPVISGDLHCFSEDTEVLTDNGWKFYSDIKAQDLVVSMNKETNQLEYNKILNFIEREHDGEVISIKGRSTDLLVTPEHRMIFRSQRNPENNITTADELSKINADYIFPCGGDLEKPEYDISDDLIKLIVWCVADGCVEYSFNKKYQKHYFSGIRWELRKERKIETLTQLFADMGIEFSHKNSRENGVKLRPTNKNIHIQYLRDLFKKGKRLPDFFRDLSVRQKKLVIQTYIETDGIQYENEIQIATAKKCEADLIQEIAVTSGHSCTSTPRIVDDKVYYNLTVCPDRTAVYLSGRSGKSNYETELYRGKVWCLTVENDTLLVRRNGKVLVTGNCPQQIGSVLYVGSLVQHKFNKWDLKSAGGVLIYDFNSQQMRRIPNTFSKHYVKLDFDKLPDGKIQFPPDRVVLQVFSEQHLEDIQSNLEGFEYYYIRKFQERNSTDQPDMEVDIQSPSKLLREYVQHNNPDAIEQVDRVLKNG